MTSNGDDANPTPKQSALEDADGQLRPNFSALGATNSIAVTVVKTPTNMTTAAKPGDIRKLVIKNFKSEYFLNYVSHYYMVEWNVLWPSFIGSHKQLLFKN